MVAPFIGFAGLTVAALIKAVVADYTANISRKKIAQSYLVERIDAKIEKKFGKDYLKNKLTTDRLKQVREVVHEELGAYSSRRDLDQLITNSLSQLTNEHQQILDKLERVESLLEKISIPLSYSIAKETNEEVPQELLQGLLEGSLQGKRQSEIVLNELVKEYRVPKETLSQLTNYSFVKRISSEGEKEMKRLIQRFSTSPQEINNLSTLMDISSLIVGPKEHLNDIVSEFIFRLIEEGLEASLVEDSIVGFTFLIHRLGKLEYLTESDHLLLSSFLKKRLTDIENPTRILESFFLLTELGYPTEIDPQFVLEIMDRHYKQGLNSTMEMENQLKLSGRLARFLRRLGTKTYKPQASMRTLRLLIKRLDKRKFVRNTQLLTYQLDRLITEINLLSAYFERKDPVEEDLTELVEILQLLLEILNRPNILNLDLKTKKQIVECMDSAYYLYDLLAIRNSWNLLNNYQLDIKSLYTPILGSYKRISTDQVALAKSLADYSRRRLELTERELPSPPGKRIKKKIRE